MKISRIFFKTPPLVSVIIATYNWSNALKLSLTSALEQTIQNIEVIVMGDGCTDDSEIIVTQVKDKRVKWLNLPRNSGSQAIPNNEGIRKAKSDFIAYLGHDDIWHPTHLESLLMTQDVYQADYIFSGAILYGPPDTKIRSVTGLPHRNIPHRTYFSPPSTIMHTKKIAEEIGGWKNTNEVQHSIDYDFQLRAWDRGSIFAATGKITAFKFPAAWWRDSYRKRDISRQQDLIDRMKMDPNFIENELMEVAKAASNGMFQIVATQPILEKKGQYHSINSLIKGTREPDNLNVEVSDKLLFTLDTDCYAFEWHEPECIDDEVFRWSGPRAESTVDIPFIIKSELEIKIHIFKTITENNLSHLRIFINNHLAPFDLQEHEKEGYVLTCIVSSVIAHAGALNNIRITFNVPQTISYCELGSNNNDRRLVGIAVGNIEVNNK